MTVEFADIVCDLAYGDCGKGKITSHYAAEGDYDFVARWAGGNNAGHTVFVNGKKYKTHLIPSGVFHGIPSVIGAGCVLHPPSFFQELDYLKKNGFDTSLVKVAPNVHIVQQKHIDFDKKNLAGKLGTTSKGIAPVYSDKFARTGTLAKDALLLKYIQEKPLHGRVLCEGAQGFWLDIDYGNYPYVTSSTTLPYAACSLGFAPQKIRKIYGAAKIYDTRSGQDPDFPETLLDDPELLNIANLGQEYGVTTGRRRKVNFLNLEKLLYAAEVTGTTHAIISKCDILEEAKTFKILHNGEIVKFDSLAEMKRFIESALLSCSDLIQEVIFSSSPERI